MSYLKQIEESTYSVYKDGTGKLFFVSENLTEELRKYVHANKVGEGLTKDEVVVFMKLMENKS